MEKGHVSAKANLAVYHRDMAGAGDHRSSLKLFRKYISRKADGNLDASQILSRECYEEWLGSRRTVPSEPEKSFQRCLSSHITAVDGLCPFTKEEEQAILEILRRKDRWPCFAHCKTRFGHAGFRAIGFHEKQARGMDPAAAQPVSKKLRTSEDVVDASYTPSSLLAHCFQIDSKMDNDEFGSGTFEQSIHKPFTVDALDSSFLEEPESHDMAIVQTLFSSSLGLMSRLSSTISTELVKHALNFFRMFLSMTGYVRPYNDADIRRLFDQSVKKYPTHSVLIIDTMALNFANRFLEQNDISRAILGPVTIGNGGCPRALIYENDTGLISSAMYTAIKFRGTKETEMVLRFLCIDNKIRHFNMAFCMDAETSLVVMHGTPSLALSNEPSGSSSS